MSPFDSLENNREQEAFREEPQDEFLDMTESDIQNFISPDRGLLIADEKKDLMKGLRVSEIEFFAGLELMIREQRSPEDQVKYLLGQIGNRRIQPQHFTKMLKYIDHLPMLDFFSSAGSSLKPEDCLKAQNDREHDIWKMLKNSPIVQVRLADIAKKGDGVRQNQVMEIRALMASIPDIQPVQQPKPALRARITQLLSIGIFK
jgi:hypothetical protein